MGCGADTVKILLLLFNILSMILGACLGAFGAVMITEFHGIVHQEFWRVNICGMVTLILGTLIFLISLVGCCGALRGNVSKLRWYSVFMLVLFIFQLVLVILVFTDFTGLEKYLEIYIKELWHSEHRKKIYKIFKNIEIQLKCCGFDGPDSYEGQQLSQSCCGYKNDAVTCEINKAYKIGCSEALINTWERFRKFIKPGSSILAGIMFAASTSASYLAHKLRQEDLYH